MKNFHAEKTPSIKRKEKIKHQKKVQTKGGKAFFYALPRAAPESKKIAIPQKIHKEFPTYNNKTMAKCKPPKYNPPPSPSLRAGKKYTPGGVTIRRLHIAEGNSFLPE